MRLKGPLARDYLKTIQDRNLDSADMRALLWEVKRLRALALYMDQLQRESSVERRNYFDSSTALRANYALRR